MPQRTYADAEAALDRHPFRNDQERREFHQFFLDATSATRGAVQRAACEAIEQQIGKNLEKLIERYEQNDTEAERLRADIAMGRINAKEAGARVDVLRRDLERLDPLIDSLRAAYEEALWRFENPLDWRDEMYQRFPVLQKPDWPW
jgi:hypothetical protein